MKRRVWCSGWEGLQLQRPEILGYNSVPCNGSMLCVFGVVVMGMRLKCGSIPSRHDRHVTRASDFDWAQFSTASSAGSIKMGTLAYKSYIESTKSSWCRRVVFGKEFGDIESRCQQ